MANCSIPNSIPANGRISTRSSRRSRKASKRARFSARLISNWPKQTSNAEHRTSKLESRTHLKVPHWMLDVGRSTFSSLRRVKGAWWPSRSSKPSSSRKWRGRFDSYPLRASFCSSCSRFAVRNVPVAHRATATAAEFRKGGDLNVP
jgi:hypothetical protein